MGSPVATRATGVTIDLNYSFKLILYSAILAVHCREKIVSWCLCVGSMSAERVGQLGHTGWNAHGRY